MKLPSNYTIFYAIASLTIFLLFKVQVCLCVWKNKSVGKVKICVTSSFLLLLPTHWGQKIYE